MSLLCLAGGSCPIQGWLVFTGHASLPPSPLLPLANSAIKIATAATGKVCTTRINGSMRRRKIPRQLSMPIQPICLEAPTCTQQLPSPAISPPPTGPHCPHRSLVQGCSLALAARSSPRMFCSMPGCKVLACCEVPAGCADAALVPLWLHRRQTQQATHASRGAHAAQMPLCRPCRRRATRPTYAG